MASRYGKNRRLSYLDVTNVFQKAANTHAGINHFAVGTLDYLDANSQNMKYPLLFLRPLQSVIVDNVRSLLFEMYLLVKPDLGDEAATKIISDAEQYTYDVASYVNRGPLQQDYEFIFDNIVPVNEAFNDRLYGWLSNVEFQIPESYNYCEYPLAETLSISGVQTYNSASLQDKVTIESNTSWNITEISNPNNFVTLRQYEGTFNEDLFFNIDNNTVSGSQRTASFSVTTEGNSQTQILSIVQNG